MDIHCMEMCFFPCINMETSSTFMLSIYTIHSLMTSGIGKGKTLLYTTSWDYGLHFADYMFQVLAVNYYCPQLCSWCSFLQVYVSACSFPLHSCFFRRINWIDEQIFHTDQWRGWCILWAKDWYWCFWCIEEKISMCNSTGDAPKRMYHVFFLDKQNHQI